MDNERKLYIVITAILAVMVCTVTGIIAARDVLVEQIRCQTWPSH